MKTRIYNARILTMEEGNEIFEGELWIDGDLISYVGPSVENRKMHPGTKKSMRKEI